MPKAVRLLVLGMLVPLALFMAAWGLEILLPATQSLPLDRFQGMALNPDAYPARYQLANWLGWYEEIDPEQPNEVALAWDGTPISCLYLTAGGSETVECTVCFNGGEQEQTLLIPAQETRLRLSVSGPLRRLTLRFSDPDVSIYRIQMESTAFFNRYRLLLMFLTFMMLYGLGIFRRQIAAHMELGFLLVGAVALLGMFLCGPAGPWYWWDGEIHYERAQYLSRLDEHLRSEPLHQVMSEMDPGSVSYALPAMVMRLASWAGAPESGQMLAGRIANGLFYLTVCALAIRAAARHKALIASIALIPLALYQSVSFSYDTFLNAFFLLGMSLMLTEIYAPSNLLSWKRGLGMLLCFALAAMPKVVYAPLILTVFLLPRSKFKNRRCQIGFDMGCVLIMLALCSGYLFRLMIAPEDVGDLRGGDVSVTSQAAFALSHPIRFIQVLADSVRETLGEFILTSGRMNWSRLGEASASLSLLSMGGLAFIGVSDTFGSEGCTALRLWQRGFLLLLCLGVLGLIYAALYMAFTQVEAARVSGVQGRYLLPLYLPAAAALLPVGLRNRMRPEGYAFAVYAFQGTVLMLLCYQLMVGRFYM